MLQNKMDISLKARICYLNPLLDFFGLHETLVQKFHLVTLCPIFFRVGQFLWFVCSLAAKLQNRERS